MDRNQRDYYRREADYTRVKQVIAVVIVLVLIYFMIANAQ